MSSDRTWVNTADYNRLRNEAASANAIRQRSEAEIRAIQVRSAERERQIRQNYDSQIRTVNNSINALSQQQTEELQRVSSDFRNRLSQQAQEIRQQNEQHTHAIRSVEARVERLTDHVNREISGMHRNIHVIDSKVNELADDFNTRFNDLVRRTSDKKERAAIAYGELQSLLASIHELRPEKFTPGELSQLERISAIIEGNMRNGDFETAIASSQENILTASRLLSRLVFLNDAFSEQLREIRMYENQLRSRFESFGQLVEEKPEYNVIQVHIGGEERRLIYDIAHWGGERFESLVNHFEQTLPVIAGAEESTLTIEGLEELANELSHINDELTACDTYARGEMIASTFVEDTVFDIHNALISQGWRHNDSGRLNNDDRKPYRMRYLDGSGNEVAIVLTAGANSEMPSFMVEVFSDDQTVGEASRRTTKDGIYSVLQRSGTQIDAVEHRNDCSENTDADSFIQNSLHEAEQRIALRSGAQNQ